MQHLSKESSSLDPSTVYHLDSDAIYRRGWQTTHIDMKNDAIMQIVSVFAIGFNKHFLQKQVVTHQLLTPTQTLVRLHLHLMDSRKSAFTKDDTAYISNIITPRAIN